MSTNDGVGRDTQRVLLTGATGFVGRHVAQALLRAGLPVRALVRSPARARLIADPGVDLVHGSLDDDATLRAACDGIGTVIHLAALTHARTDAEFEAVNVEGTARLVRAMVETGAPPLRLVYLSSLAAVGPAIDGRGVTADDPPNPLTAYGRSKLGGERVVLGAAAQMETVILRAPAVYGPHDTDLFHFFRMAKRGVLVVPTGPVRPLQMVHVQDLARALVLAVNAKRASGIYHVAEARSYPWEDVGRMVAAAVGSSPRTVRVPAVLISIAAAASGFVTGLAGRSTIFNRDKARELLAPGWLCETERVRADLGFEAGIPLAEGLRTTATWYREQGWL